MAQQVQTMASLPPRPPSPNPRLSRRGDSYVPGDSYIPARDDYRSRDRYRYDRRRREPRSRSPPRRRSYRSPPPIRLGNHVIENESPSPPRRSQEDKGKARDDRPTRDPPPRESMREPPREPMRESMRELPRESMRELPRESMRELPRESMRETPRESPRESPREPREPPREPRAARRGASPPRGPRNSEPARPPIPNFNPPIAPRGPRPKKIEQPKIPNPPLPVLPPYYPPDIKTEFDAEIQRLQAHRAILEAEHKPIAKATRRALHELELARMDLRAAETRRIMLAAQAEKAKFGLLGIDYQQEHVV